MASFRQWSEPVSSRAAYANRSRRAVYRKTPIAGVTVAGTKQWLNPEAFVSVVDPTTGACTGGDSPATASSATRAATPCADRTSLTPTSTSPKRFPFEKAVTFRLDAQMFNAFNHPNFALPSEVQAGVPGGSSQPGLERSKARSRLPPACSASDLAVTVRRA